MTSHFTQLFKLDAVKNKFHSFNISCSNSKQQKILQHQILKCVSNWNDLGSDLFLSHRFVWFGYSFLTRFQQINFKVVFVYRNTSRSSQFEYCSRLTKNKCEDLNCYALHHQQPFYFYQASFGLYKNHAFQSKEDAFSHRNTKLFKFKLCPPTSGNLIFTGNSQAPKFLFLFALSKSK